MTPCGKARLRVPVKLTPQASKVWRLLTERGAAYTLTEITRDLSMSKTVITRALAELEEAGLVSLSMEDV